jgi:hypothetical protein
VTRRGFFGLSRQIVDDMIVVGSSRIPVMEREIFSSGGAWMEGSMMHIEGANATDNVCFIAASAAASFPFRAGMSPRSSADDKKAASLATR